MVKGWIDQALCRDADWRLFQTTPGMKATPELLAARAICKLCPVADKCYEVAVEVDEFWKGDMVRAGRKPVAESGRAWFRKKKMPAVDPLRLRDMEKFLLKHGRFPTLVEVQERRWREMA